MAEALLRAAAAIEFEATSAGSEPSPRLDGVDEVLREVGIREFLAASRDLSGVLVPPPDLVVVLCEEGCLRCPYVPGARRVVRWPQPDPDTASPTERIRVLRRVREDLQLRIAHLVNVPPSWASSAR